MTINSDRDLSSPAVVEIDDEIEQEQPAVARHALSKSDVLDADDLIVEEVSVPEWGGKGAVILICPMSGFHRDKFEESLQGKQGGTNLSNIRAKMVAASAVNEDGSLLFTDADVPKLGKKNAKALDRCFTVARRLSGFTEEDIDELAKNS